jgi:hypothetical protein
LQASSLGALHWSLFEILFRIAKIDKLNMMQKQR